MDRAHHFHNSTLRERIETLEGVLTALLGPLEKAVEA